MQERFVKPNVRVGFKPNGPGTADLFSAKRGSDCLNPHNLGPLRYRGSEQSPSEKEKRGIDFA